MTFFFNCGLEEPFPGEDRVLVPSPRDVPTYAHKPEMSARIVTERLVAGIADRVMVMYGGLVVEHPPVAVLYGRALHPYPRAPLETPPSAAATRSPPPLAPRGQPPLTLEAPSRMPLSSA